MSYAPYPAYKDSGVPWLGQVPEGWEVKRLRYASKLADERLPYDEVQRPYVGLENIVSWTGKRIVDDEARADGIVALFERGDVLFGKLRPYLAKVHRAEVAGCSSTEALILRGKSGLDTHFLKYFMLSPAFIDEVNATTYGAKMPRANWSDVGGLPVSLPPIEEQTAIADFLDKKTAEIDDLIAKKEELLRLLAEQRTALITHAVTKGLNPNAPMKPSGIDWLGDVPDGWRVVPFKWCCQVQSGQADPRLDEYKVLPLIAPDHIESGTGRLLPYETAEEQGAISGKYQFAAGEVLYSKIRPELSKVALAPEDGLCSADMYAIRAMEGLRPEFLFYQMLSRHFHRFAVLESMRVAMPKINRESLGVFPVMVPDEDEQDEILDHIKSELAKMDLVEEKITMARNYLKEYRTAVITNAVTGKIKVI